MKKKLKVGDMFEVKGCFGIWFIITENGHVRIGEEVTTLDKKSSIFFSKNAHDKTTVMGGYTYLGNCLD